MGHRARPKVQKHGGRRMKKLVVFSVALLLCCALVGSVAIGGEEKAAKQVTLEGTIACAKCTLQKAGQGGCQNVLIVEKEGEKKQFYMTQNEVYEEFGSVCKATPNVTVTGMVEKKDGVKWITPTEITMAATITDNSRAIPTAVMTESSENTTSISATCTSTEPKLAVPAASWACASEPSSLSWISQVAFPIRNRPPPRRIRSRPETTREKTSKSGCVSPTIQLMAKSSPIRMTIARERPILRPRAR